MTSPNASSYFVKSRNLAEFGEPNFRGILFLTAPGKPSPSGARLIRQVRERSAAEHEEHGQQPPRAPCQARCLDVNVRLLHPQLQPPCPYQAGKAGKGLARGRGAPQPGRGWHPCVSHRHARSHRPRPPRRQRPIDVHQLLEVLVRPYPTKAQQKSHAAATPRRNRMASAVRNLGFSQCAGPRPRSARRVLGLVLGYEHVK